MTERQVRMSTTADGSFRIVIYAVGAGRGHLVRARAIAETLIHHGGSADDHRGTSALRIAIVAHPAAIDREAVRPPIETIASCGGADALDGLTGDLLIVDSLPHGFRGEISGPFLRRFRRRVFLARYNRELTAESLAPLCDKRYDGIVLPYPEGMSEWDGEVERGRYVGHLVRTDRVTVVPLADRFTVVDPEGRCTDVLRAAFERIAAASGFELNYVRSYSRTLSGSRLLIIGAGYNAFYELLSSLASLPADRCASATGDDRSRPAVRFIPVEKRWDDQRRRTDLYGLTAGSLEQVAAWLTDFRTPAFADCDRPPGAGASILFDSHALVQTDPEALIRGVLG